MTSPFIWSEILLFTVPIAIIYFVNQYFKSYLKYFEEYPLTLAILLIPLWLTLIKSFSSLIFGFSLVAFIIFITSFALGLHLYDYIRFVNHFSFKKYYQPASRLVFIILSAFLLGLILLRIYTYFA